MKRKRKKIHILVRYVGVVEREKNSLGVGGIKNALGKPEGTQKEEFR